MTTKDRYIGSFKIKDIVPHRGTKIVSNMKPDDSLILQYDTTDKIIFVKRKNSKSLDIIGELDQTGGVEKFMLPLLRCKKGDDLFECEISYNRGCPLNLNRLYVDVWAKEA